MLKKASFCALVLGLLSASAYAQFWPLPNYTTPDTPVTCSLCQQDALGMPTPGWHDPVVRYVGRFVSSEYVADFQHPYRTARAGGIIFSPDGSRLALRLGQGVATYDTANFLSRLDAHEPMVSVSTLGVTPGDRFGGALEIFLNFERYFYAENSSSNWLLAYTDGQDRLGVYDYDDRGLLYIAYDQFGWGIASDLPTTLAAGKLMSSWQDKLSFADTPAGCGSPPPKTPCVTKAWAPVNTAFWIKDGTDYYALAYGSHTSTITHLFKVPAYNTASEVASIGTPIVALARLSGRTAVLPTGAVPPVIVYDNHSLVTGGRPLATISYAGSPSQVVSDGTYFWAAVSVNGGTVLSRIAPDGSHTEFPTTTPATLSMNYGSGYIATATLDGNIHLFKVSSGTPVEAPALSSISGYFRNQAGFAPKAPHMSILSANPVVANGKLYLIVNADGLGDVYQIRTDDTVNISMLGTNGPVNPNAPARAPGDVFYGDTVKLSAALSSGQLGGALSWNFGAPHDPANTAPGSFGAPINHQYTGLLKTDISAPVTISATNSANGIVGAIPLQLKTGTARIKFGSSAGTKYLVTLPGTGAPVVVGDSFYDASDGDTGGHFAEWRVGIDPPTVTSPTFIPQFTDPITPVSVGTCGQHSLYAVMHYGYPAYNANNIDFPVTLAPANNSSVFTYTVTAFSPGVDVSYNAGTGNEEFSSTSRAAAALAGRTFAYTWDVVDSNGAAVPAIPPQSGSVTSVDQIPHYPVSKALFSQAGYKGRLTLTVSGADPCSDAGGTMPAQQATSNPLVTPDAQLTAVCNNPTVGVCQYTITSPSNVMQSDVWTFAWTANGGSPSSGNASSLTTSYYSAGTFNLSVTVTNKTGLTKTLTYSAGITTPAVQCPQFVQATMGITYHGTSPSTTCVDGSACSPNEDIEFDLGFFQTPTQGCLDSLGYSWTVDGGGATAGPTVDASFSAGVHTVSLALTNGAQKLSFSRQITIGTVTPPNPPPNNPPPNNPPPSKCGVLNAGTVDLEYSGAVSTSCHVGGSCGSGETVNFNIQYWNYNYLCATHTYSWSFDGVPGTGDAQAAHSFTGGGAHTASVTISNGSSSYTATVTVTISGGSTPNPPVTPPTGCPALSIGQNVFFDYTGGTSGCHSNGDPCVAGEPITMAISFWPSTCGTPLYSWAVDGSPIEANTQNTVLTLTSGTHTVACTVNNGGVPATLTQTITVNNGATPQYTFDFVGASLTAPGIPANTWVFNLSTDPEAVEGQTQWVWNFGDNSGEVTGSGVQTHTYQNGTDYTVTVHAINQTQLKSHRLSELVPSRRRSVRH